MSRRSKKKQQRIPKQVVVPQEPQKRMEAFWQQIRWVQRDWKALGTPHWHMFSQGIEIDPDYNTEVEAWRGLGFTGWIVYSRFYMSPCGYLFQVWAVVDGDQQRIWYPKTGRTIPFSSLDTTPLILYPQREEAEESQSDTRRVQYLYPLGSRVEIEEQDIKYPGGIYHEIHVKYGIIFDVADRPMVTDGVQFWWAWTHKEQPPKEMADRWDVRHFVDDEYYLENLFEEAEPDDDTPELGVRGHYMGEIVQKWLRKRMEEVERIRQEMERRGEL